MNTHLQELQEKCRNFHLLRHPIIQAKLARLRDCNTETCEYRRVLGELGAIIGYEASRDMRVRQETVQSTMAPADVQVLDEDIVLVPLLRGGLAMVEAMLLQFRFAQVYHLGLRKEPESGAWVSFYCKLPADLSGKYVMLLEPSLTTGSKTSFAVDFLKNHGAGRIKCICVVGTEEGVRTLCHNHPDVDLYLIALDRGVNDQGMISPGIGEVGDRVLGK